MMVVTVVVMGVRVVVVMGKVMVMVVVVVVVVIMFAGENSTFATVFNVLEIDQCARSNSKEDLPARGVSPRPSFVSTQFTHILKLVAIVSSTFLLRNGLFSSSLGWKCLIVRSIWFGNHIPPRLATALLCM